MIKLYLSQKAVDPTQKLNAFPLLSEFFDRETLTFSRFNENYDSYFRITENIEDCDCIVLTHSLNFYYDNQLKEKIQYFIDEVKKYGKPGWVFSGGDYAFKFKEENIYYFRTSGYQSRLTRHDIIMPVLIKDPYANQALDLKFEPAPYEKEVNIGFCGQASFSSLETLKTVYKVNLLNLQSQLSINNYELNRQFYSPFFRKLVLSRFKKSHNLQCNFIERKKYRAGINLFKKAKKENHQTTIEYFKNIFTNHYSLAIRGAGNFSNRFFDIFAMGRIPIFINYDSPLPFKEKLLKENLIIEIDSSLKNFESKILQYHRQFNPETFESKQLSIRNFWLENYTKLGFYRQIHNQFAPLKQVQLAL